MYSSTQRHHWRQLSNNLTCDLFGPLSYCGHLSWIQMKRVWNVLFMSKKPKSAQGSSRVVTKQVFEKTRQPGSIGSRCNVREASTWWEVKDGETHFSRVSIFLLPRFCRRFLCWFAPMILLFKLTFQMLLRWDHRRGPEDRSRPGPGAWGAAGGEQGALGQGGQVVYW